MESPETATIDTYSPEIDTSYSNLDTSEQSSLAQGLFAQSVPDVEFVDADYPDSEILQADLFAQVNVSEVVVVDDQEEIEYYTPTYDIAVEEKVEFLNIEQYDVVEPLVESTNEPEMIFSEVELIPEYNPKHVIEKTEVSSQLKEVGEVAIDLVPDIELERKVSNELLTEHIEHARTDVEQGIEPSPNADRKTNASRIQSYIEEPTNKQIPLRAYELEEEIETPLKPEEPDELPEQKLGFSVQIVIDPNSTNEQISAVENTCDEVSTYFDKFLIGEISLFEAYNEAVSKLHRTYLENEVASACVTILLSSGIILPILYESSSIGYTTNDGSEAEVHNVEGMTTIYDGIGIIKVPADSIVYSTAQSIDSTVSALEAIQETKIDEATAVYSEESLLGAYIANPIPEDEIDIGFNDVDVDLVPDSYIEM